MNVSTRTYSFLAPEACAEDVRSAISELLNRMGVSYFKYGAVADAYPLRVKALDSLQLRVETYLKGGNAEFLLDAVNFAMIEYMHPSVPGGRRLPSAPSICGSVVEVFATATVPPEEFSRTFLQAVFLRDGGVDPERRILHAADCLERYRESADADPLVSAAASLLRERWDPRREGSFFEATDSDQSPGRVAAHGHAVTTRNDSPLWDALGILNRSGGSR